MNELIKIEKVKIGEREVSSVSARELYLGLGLNQAVWSRWSKTNIEENAFFSQDIDFIELNIVLSVETPNPPKDYAEAFTDERDPPVKCVRFS